MSFSVTTWALGALRAGRLDAAAAQLGGSHLAAANLFHSGAMYEFHSRYAGVVVVGVVVEVCDGGRGRMQQEDDVL